MRWITPTEKDTANETLERRLWDAADQFRANSGLKAGQYSTPVLGLIFLRFAEARFAKRRAQLSFPSPSGRGAGGEGKNSRRGSSRIDDPKAYQAEGVLFLTPSARFDYLQQLPEGGNVGKGVNEAMADIEKHNPQLGGVLPRNYQIFNGTLLKELLKKVSEIPVCLDYDAFGRIYEYFLGQFARTEGQKGGEFYTPAPIVRLMVEILEPFHGRILDPACGSGGMFVQSEEFIVAHGGNLGDISIYGQESNYTTWWLARMNLAIRGIDHHIVHGDAFHNDRHPDLKADTILTNPPFNMSGWRGELLREDKRWQYGVPPPRMEQTPSWRTGYD